MRKIYRVMKPLSTGHIQGEVIKGTRFKTQDIVDALVRVGAILEISGPPLIELPGWKLRATKLNKLGVNTVNDFLAGGMGTLAKQLDYKEKTLERWYKEIEEVWLLAVTPEPKNDK
jgi:hypothetical protein